MMKYYLAFIRARLRHLLTPGFAPLNLLFWVKVDHFLVRGDFVVLVRRVDSSLIEH